MKRLFFFLIFSLVSLDVFAACGGYGSADTPAECYANAIHFASNPNYSQYMYYCNGRNLLRCARTDTCPLGNLTCMAGGVPVYHPDEFDVSYESCHAENKPFNPSTEQCEAACSVGSTVGSETNECEFSGCPAGSVQIGHACSSLPELPLPNEDDEIVCNSGGCFFEPSTCNPSSPDYQGTTNDTHFCNAPPLSCGANQTSGFSDLGDGYVRVCVDQGNPDTNIADCPQGYVSINGICSQPDFQVKEQTNTVVEIGEDGTKKVTDTTTTTKNNKDGTTTTTTTTTTKTYDENDNLIGESSTQGEDEGKEGSSVSGGGSCAIEPSCSGADAVQCEILKEQWRLRCGGNPAAKKGLDFGDVAGQKIVAAQGEYDSAINTIKGQIASTLSFDLSGQAGGIPCNVIEIRGVSLDFSWCKFSDYLSWLGLVFIAIAYVRAFQIILG